MGILFAENVDVQRRQQCGECTPRLLAAGSHPNLAVQKAIERGAGANAVDADGWSTLHFAAQSTNELACHFAEKKKRAVSAKILREAKRKRPRRIFFVLFAMFWRLLRTCVETPMSLFYNCDILAV